MDKMFTERLGHFARDQVSGLEGVINATVLWDRGNLQYSIQPQIEATDKEKKQSYFCDVAYIEIKGEKPPLKTSHTDFGEFKFKNGSPVRNKKHGMKGFVTGQAVWIAGCRQYYVTSNKLTEKGEVIEHWFDEIELEPDAGVFSKKPFPATEARPNGGPSIESKMR